MENEHYIAVDAFCTHYGIEVSFIRALTESGLVEIIMVQEIQCIPKERIPHIERMIRLHYDLHINIEGIEAVSHLLQQIETLQEEVKELRNRLGNGS